MKAIQIKYCGPTNTKGARWKVWAESCPVKYMPRDYALNGDADAYQNAYEYVKFMQWHNPIEGFGMLPNGDYVATLCGGVRAVA